MEIESKDSHGALPKIKENKPSKSHEYLQTIHAKIKPLQEKFAQEKQVTHYKVRTQIDNLYRSLETRTSNFDVSQQSLIEATIAKRIEELLQKNQGKNILDNETMQILTSTLQQRNDGKNHFIESREDANNWIVMLKEMETIVEMSDEGVIPTLKKNEVIEYLEYIIKRGDTLTKVARQFGVDVEEIVKMNQITNRDLIIIGKILKIPQSQLKKSENESEIKIPQSALNVREVKGLEKAIKLKSQESGNEAKPSLPKTKGVQSVEAVGNTKKVEGEGAVPNTKGIQGAENVPHSKGITGAKSVPNSKGVQGVDGIPGIQKY